MIMICIDLNYISKIELMRQDDYLRGCLTTMAYQKNTNHHIHHDTPLHTSIANTRLTLLKSIRHESKYNTHIHRFY